MLASIPACLAVTHKQPYGDSVTIHVSPRSDGETWDPHVMLMVEFVQDEDREDVVITLSLEESEILETALRVARQKVRIRR